LRRRDQLTYDLGQQGRAPVPWKSVLLLAAVIAVAGLLVVWVVASRPTPQAAPAGVPTFAPPTSADPTGPAGSASASPAPSGSDAAEGLGVPDGSQQAASAFVRAWLDRDAKTRGPALRAVATPALAEQLMLTDPRKVPMARPRGAPVLEDASTFSSQFTQRLSTGMRISVYLVAEPGARYGWLATSVDQA